MTVAYKAIAVEAEDIWTDLWKCRVLPEVDC